MWENFFFWIYGVQIPRKYIDSMPQFPTQNSMHDFLKICLPKDEGGGANYDLSKLNQNM